MRSIVALLLVAATSLPACRSSPPSPYLPPTEQERNTYRAEQLNREAADLIEGDPESAEALLREALAADLFYGPAHNNLGVVFLERGDLYEAAQEFEWARKLLPSSPDPRINLALVLERAGRWDEALDAYEGALAVAPESVAAMQGWAALVVDRGLWDAALEEQLRQLTVDGETSEWREWARGHLSDSGEVRRSPESHHLPRPRVPRGVDRRPSTSYTVGTTPRSSMAGWAAYMAARFTFWGVRAKG